MLAKVRRLSPGLIWFAVTLALPPASGQGTDDTRLYKDPSGEFEIRVPKNWQVERIEDARSGMRTGFRSPDETGFLTILCARTTPELNRDAFLIEIGNDFFHGWRSALEDKERYENLKSGELKKEKHRDRDRLRQDFTYRRRNSPVPRESSAYLFFTNNSLVFVTISGTVEGIKAARNAFDTLVPGPAKPVPDITIPKPNEDELNKIVFLDPESARKQIVGLEPQLAQAPRDLKLLNALKAAYVRMMYHYKSGDLKAERDAKQRAEEYLDKSHLIRMRIATETLRGLKVPKRVTKPGPKEELKNHADRSRDQSYELWLGYEKVVEESRLTQSFLSFFRRRANDFACDTAEWIKDADLGTKLDRERSSKLLKIAVAHYNLIENYFQRERAKGTTAPPEQLGFTDLERQLSEQLRRALDQLAPGGK